MRTPSAREAPPRGRTVPRPFAPAERERRPGRGQAEDHGRRQHQGRRGGAARQQPRGQGADGGAEEAPRPDQAVEPLRLGDGEEISQDHPELQDGEAPQEAGPHVERVELERALPAAYQPEDEGDRGPEAEQPAEGEAPRGPAPAPGDLGESHRDEGDQQVDDRQLRGGQPRQEERVARRLEQGVPGQRPEDGQERRNRAPALVGAHREQARHGLMARGRRGRRAPC